MSYPIVEQIAQAIATQLATITTDNGYQTDITEVTRPTRDSGWTWQHLGIVLIQGTSTPMEAPLGFTSWTTAFSVVLLIKTGDESTTPVDLLINTGIADIHKAMMVDQQWSSLADDTSPGVFEINPPTDGSYYTAAITFHVLYRHLRLDPFSQ